MNKYEITQEIRQRVSRILKKYNIKYDFNAILSGCYSGEGFYINHRYKVLNQVPNYCYDIHMAYTGSLKQFKFPLSSRLGDKETELGIFCIKFEGDLMDNCRYEDFYYTLFRDKTSNKLGKVHYMYITNLDYEILCDLYDMNFQIINKQWFQDIDFLPTEIHDMVDEYYIKKKNDTPDNKPFYEAGFYGCFATNLRDNVKKKYDAYIKSNDKRDAAIYHQAEEKYDRAYAETGYELVRNNQVPIAIFQAAYLRYREWKNFKKYQDSVVYMNTDSIHTDVPIDIECKNEIGHYDVESISGKKIAYIRRNAYCALNDDGSIFESVIGGVINGGDMDKWKIKMLCEKHLPVKARTLDKDGNIVEIELQPKFFLELFPEPIKKKKFEYI